MKRLILTAMIATTFTACATSPTMPVLEEVGPIMLHSQYSFSQTESKLRQALSDRNLKLFDVIDHGEGAKSVGMDIGQSKLFIFGNPKSGTPLMEENRLVAFELPMKILLSEEADGKVIVARTDIKSVAADYRITVKEDLLSKISMTLSDIAFEATR